MTFIWPIMLWLLIILPVFFLVYVRLVQRRRRLIAEYGSMGLVQASRGRAVGYRRHVTPFLFLIGLGILIVSLARPQAVVSLPRIQGTVILVFDISGSMAADDVKPTRIEAAKSTAQNFVDSQPDSVMVGVVAFSNSGLSVQVPTNEKEAVMAAISRLTPARGTSLANGIYAALTTIAAAGRVPETRFYNNVTPEPTATPTPVPQGVYSPAIIVLISDGENTQNPDPLPAAQAAADRGVRIYSIGIGTTAGADLSIDGFMVHTQLDEGMLKQISQVSSGTYYNAQSEQDFDKIYDNIRPQLTVRPEKMEVTSLFAGVSILVLLIGGIISLGWFSRLP